MASISISAGENTEDIIQYITQELSDEELDCIDVERDFEKVTGLASEPLTTTAIVTLGSLSIISISRLIERWMENKRQTETLRIVAEGFNQSSEAGIALEKIAKKHSNVSLTYKLATIRTPSAE